MVEAWVVVMGDIVAAMLEVEGVEAAARRTYTVWHISTLEQNFS